MLVNRNFFLYAEGEESRCGELSRRKVPRKMRVCDEAGREGDCPFSSTRALSDRMHLGDPAAGRKEGEEFLGVLCQNER